MTKVQIYPSKLDEKKFELQQYIDKGYESLNDFELINESAYGNLEIEKLLKV